MTLDLISEFYIISTVFKMTIMFIRCLSIIVSFQLIIQKGWCSVNGSEVLYGMVTYNVIGYILIPCNSAGK